LICLVPCAVVGLVAGYALWPARPKPDLEHDGGTVLVYEVNLEQTARRKKAMDPDAAGAAPQGLSSEELGELARQIKRRIDPDDIKNVTVRPVGDRRLEISVPFGIAARNAPPADAELEEVKGLVSQMGVLEFRILANGVDDLEGIRATEAEVKAMGAERLGRAAKNGEPPDAPREQFNVTIGDTESRVRYVWVELGPEERNSDSVRLSNRFEGQGQLWNLLAKRRDQAVPVRDGGPAGELVEAETGGAKMLLFSRECVSRDQIEIEVNAARRAVAEGKLPKELIEGTDEAAIHKRILADPKAVEIVNPKKVDYFVLTRVSPEDSLRVGGEVTLTARAETDSRTFNPAVNFSLNETGARKFGALTRRNRPSGNTTRHLAILLDDRVVTAPSLQAEIGAEGQITGKFDRKYVERLVQMLQSGALSAELKEKPVSENTIAPTLTRDTASKKTRAIGLALGAAVVTYLVCALVYWKWATGRSGVVGNTGRPGASG
jgi:SecD/SecF fusion protein